jgi:hypothetical protein
MRTGVARRTVWATAIMLCIVTVGTAQDNKNRERVYDAPFEKVWSACVQAASEKYVITHSEKASGVLSFKQGMSWKTNSYGMDVGVTVVAVSDTQTKVTLNPQKQKSQLSWAGSDITKKFFEAVDKNLSANARPSAP